jgi:hypothetical protein
MKTIDLLVFPYYFMIPNGLMRIFSGASCVNCGVLGEIGVIWPKSLAKDWMGRPWHFPHAMAVRAGL